MDLRRFIRTVENFPKKGIAFKDVSPLLAHPAAFAATITELKNKYHGTVDAVAALDARGFLFGAPLALALGVPFVMIRKKGKLPGPTYETSYGLEYGSDTIEVQEDGLSVGMNVLVVDDLLATGGTARAACYLVEKTGATVASVAFIVELSELCGRAKLSDYEVHALITY